MVFSAHEIQHIIKNEYGINKILLLRKDVIGRGTNYFVETTENNYFLKIVSTNDKTVNLYNEVKACTVMNNAGLPVSRFVKNSANGFVTEFSNGYICHLQLTISGKLWVNNSAPKWLMLDGASLLARIHLVLRECNFPLSCKFQNLNNKELHLLKLEQLKKLAIDISPTKYNAIIEQLQTKINILSDQPFFEFEKFSLENTHCDYAVVQFLTNNKEISAVIDFSEVAKAPAAWEILRFYAHSAEEVTSEAFRSDLLKKMFKVYSKTSLLTYEEITNSLKLYRVQLAQSDYGYKELLQNDDDRYIQHAYTRMRILEYIDRNMEKLSVELSNFDGGGV